MRNKPALITLALIVLGALIIFAHDSTRLFSLVAMAGGLAAIATSNHATKYYMAHPPYEDLQPGDSKLVRFAFISFGVAMFIFGALALIQSLPG